MKSSIEKLLTQFQQQKIRTVIVQVNAASSLLTLIKDFLCKAIVNNYQYHHKKTKNKAYVVIFSRIGTIYRFR